MKIACNDSNELREIIGEKKIDIDYIKWPSFNPNIWSIQKSLEAGKPILIHGFMGAVDYYTGKHIDFTQVDQQEVEKVKEQFNMPYYSCHIGGLVSQIQGIDWKGIECSEEEEQQLLQQSINNLREIKKIFNKPIIIENIPIFQNCKIKFPKCVGKTEFISELVKEADVDLLLDIAHARVTASMLGMDIYEYLDNLPLQRIVEVHVSGVKQSNIEQLVDFHCEMDDTDIELLNYITTKTNKLETITHEFTPTDKDFYLLKDNNRYEVITAEGMNPKAKQLLEKDLIELQKVKEKYIKETERQTEEEGR